jgi:hypothetical protein
MGGKWGVPKGGVVGGRLLVGGAIFGTGWCIPRPSPYVSSLPGSGRNRVLIFRVQVDLYVNLGTTAIQRNLTFWLLAGWLVPFVLGGAFAESI